MDPAAGWLTLRRADHHAPEQHGRDEGQPDTPARPLNPSGLTPTPVTDGSNRVNPATSRHPSSGYVEADQAQGNWLYTVINEGDPLTGGPTDSNTNPFLTTATPAVRGGPRACNRIAMPAPMIAPSNRPKGQAVMATVVLADRPPLIRGGGLRDLLSTVDDLVVAGEAPGSEAVGAVRRHRPDVLVLDPFPGVEVIRQACRVAPGTAVLVVSTLADDASVRAAIRAGARGYLRKGTEEAGIVPVIRSLAAGEAIFGASIAGRIATLFATPPFDELTAREREVFELLCTGMSTVAIARRLTLAPKTVRNNLSVIFAKLRVSDRAEAIAAGAALAG